jgi:hypothetical protein
MRAKNRVLSVLTTTGYVLVITLSALFHDHTGHYGGCCGKSGESPTVVGDETGTCHHGTHDESRHAPVSLKRCPTDDTKCPVCQFLAQKPAPVDPIASVTSAERVEEVVGIAPACSSAGVFTAWHSRAPPAIA